jgi:hypothetical protein
MHLVGRPAPGRRKQQRAPDDETGRPALPWLVGYNINPVFYWIF